MTVSDLKDDEGRTFAFEVETLTLSRRQVRRIVESIPDVRVLAYNGRWLLDADERVCEFELDAVKFLVWEPWGDSSHYWVGADPSRWTPQLELVRRAFTTA